MDSLPDISIRNGYKYYLIALILINSTFNDFKYLTIVTIVDHYVQIIPIQHDDSVIDHRTNQHQHPPPITAMLKEALTNQTPPTFYQQYKQNIQLNIVQNSNVINKYSYATLRLYLQSSLCR